MRFRRRSWSLRVRLAMLSVLSAALVLLLGGAGLLAVLRSELLSTVDNAALDSAESLAETAYHGTLPREIVSTEEVSTTAQVVQEGEVISATSNALGDPPILNAPQKVGQSTVIQVEELAYDDDGPFRIAAWGADSPTGPVTIYVAVDAEDVNDVVNLAAEIGAVAALVILTVLSGLLWFIIGFALSPVTRIRERAEDITKRGLHLRVPVPDTDDEIAALATTINSMLARIETGVARQDAFVADAAHELRTPLATLRTRLDVALLQPTQPESELLRELLDDVVRMGGLVDQLLLLARSDSGLLSTALEPVDVDDLVVRTAANFEHDAIVLSTEETVPVQVMGNLALLEQVLPNLVANASRFATSRIDIGVQAAEDKVVITVDDDGPGIPEADRKRVFERFIRLDESRVRGTGGSGLGLAIVTQIVRMHGGRVEADASPLGGARFRIELPTSETADIATVPENGVSEKDHSKSS